MLPGQIFLILFDEVLFANDTFHISFVHFTILGIFLNYIKGQQVSLVAVVI
jgi:hypothetical protein